MTGTAPIQILMPMAGGARPFRDSGETFPKAIVEVLGHPLAQYAIESSRPSEPHRFVFVVDAASDAKFHLEPMLKVLAPDCAVVKAAGPTGGALCTCLLAIDEIDLEAPLLVCNGDQYLADGVDDALAAFRADDLDVGIITFTAVHPRWSFVRRDDDGLVCETAEKQPISNEATVGAYYYRTGGLFLQSAGASLLKQVTHNGQYFVVPSINQVILEGGRVGAHRIEGGRFHPLGIPEDVDRFIQTFGTSPIA